MKTSYCLSLITSLLVLITAQLSHSQDWPHFWPVGLCFDSDNKFGNPAPGFFTEEVHEEWSVRHDGPGSDWDYDQGNDIAVDSWGNVFVTGQSYGAELNDPVTIMYDVYTWKFDHPFSDLMATDARFIVKDRNGISGIVSVDQSTAGDEWIFLGNYEFDGSSVQGVGVTDEADGYVIADAVRLVPAGP